MASAIHSPGDRRVVFERNPARVIYDPSSGFVVTWSTCSETTEERLAKRRDPERCLPSVSAITDLMDRGRIPDSLNVQAALAISRAYMSGDRYLLDSDGARSAAQLVSDLAALYAGSSGEASSDVYLSIRGLIDEMSAVRFASSDESAFSEESVIPAVEAGVAECDSENGFWLWENVSKRRRFLYSLRRRNRTDVMYTLVSAMFVCGTCPLLSMKDRDEMSRGTGIMCPYASKERLLEFSRKFLEGMRSLKESGRCRLHDKSH